MPGKGHKFSAKQDRMAIHIMESQQKKGMPMDKAKSVGYASAMKNKMKGKGMKKGKKQ